MFESLGIDSSYIILGLAAVVFILIILVIILYNKIAKLNKKYNTFMHGKTAEDLESVIIERFQELDVVHQIETKHATEIKELKKKLRGCYSKTGMVKYDAFKEMGGTLSFALALLDEHNNGFVINSMHSREGCYTYVKEIIKGESYIVLSEEEKEAIKNAVNMKNPIPTE